MMGFNALMFNATLRVLNAAYTKKQLAEAAGVSPKTMANLIRGAEPSMVQFDKICQAFSLTSYLFFGAPVGGDVDSVIMREVATVMALRFGYAIHKLAEMNKIVDKFNREWPLPDWEDPNDAKAIWEVLNALKTELERELKNI